jgi:hypothetical protein
MHLVSAVEVTGNKIPQRKGQPCINPPKQLTSRQIETVPFFTSFPHALFLNNCNAIF